MQRAVSLSLLALPCLLAAGCGPGADDGAPAGPCPSLTVDGEPRTPLDFGKRALADALARSGVQACIWLDSADTDEGRARLALLPDDALDPRPESYVITATDLGPLVLGRDAAGTMYGALELAERVRRDRAAALRPAEPVRGAPAMPIRGANLFLVLPTDGERAWWFHDERFWSDYLDLLARSRLNFLDLHAMYNPHNTVFPNALLWFATSPSYPNVGVPEAERARNLAMLRRVVEMAAARGVRVALMSYRADPSHHGDRQDFPLDEHALKRYTREAVADLARQVPGLWRLGFRIGESLRQDPNWYTDTFVAGLRDAGTGVLPYTRTWQIEKKDMLTLLQQSGADFLVEAKLNGEQLGAPYAIQGGAFANHWWGGSTGIYSYQDYLDPPTPYTFVFQVRTCSTHRMFRYASYERTRRTIASLTLGASRGFTLEAPHAFYPQRDFYHLPEDRFSDWTFRRDELMYLLFGRLSYDPITPEAPFREAVVDRTGSPELWDAMQAASDIVPWMQMAMTCGPDTRDYAPDLEWGGTVGEWAKPAHSTPGECNFRAPFDTFAVASPAETAADLLAGRPTTRLTPVEIARIVADDAARARGLLQAAEVDLDNAEARDIARETRALADLGDYAAHKLRAATALAVYGGSGAPDWIAAARSEARAAAASYVAVAAATAHIQPFDEYLRMILLQLPTFHWRQQLPLLPRDLDSIDAVEKELNSRVIAPQPVPPAGEFLSTARPEPPPLAGIEIIPPDPRAPVWTVTARFRQPLPSGSRARILWRRFANVTEWAPVESKIDPSGTAVSATVAGGGQGGVFAVEIATRRGAFRLPDVVRETPYVTLALAR